MRGRREQRNPAILSISRQYEAGTHVREKPQHHATHFLCGIAASAAADLYRRKFRLGRMSLPPLRGRGTNRVTDIATLSSGLLHVHTVARSACAVCTQCLSSSNGARPASNGIAEVSTCRETKQVLLANSVCKVLQRLLAKEPAFCTPCRC